MNVKQLLVLSIAATGLAAHAETAADKTGAAPTTEQQVNIVKVIDFTHPQKTEASQEAKTRALLAGDDKKELRDIDYDRPNLRKLVDFHGRKTANGETYDMNELTAAHKELPLGTKVEVTNLSNGRKVVVRINDRGPFHGNRVLDLSRAAAQELGTLNAGVAQVQIRALQ